MVLSSTAFLLRFLPKKKKRKKILHCPYQSVNLLKERKPLASFTLKVSNSVFFFCFVFFPTAVGARRRLEHTGTRCMAECQAEHFPFLKFILWLSIQGAKGTSPKATLFSVDRMFSLSFPLSFCLSRHQTNAYSLSVL